MATRSRIELVHRKLTERMPPDIFLKVFLGGSYIRGRERPGDVDLALLVSDYDQSLAWLQDFAGDRWIQGGYELGRFMYYGTKVDFWATTDPLVWGPLCIFVAGSGRFNVAQRTRALRLGYTLSQKGLFRGKELIPCQTQRDVYAVLGWNWVPYEERWLSSEVH